MRTYLINIKLRINPWYPGVFRNQSSGLGTSFAYGHILKQPARYPVCAVGGSL